MILLLLIQLVNSRYILNKCQSCCRIQILSLYNPITSNHKYNYNNNSEIYWVIDFQFDDEKIVTTRSGNELEFRLRPLEVREHNSSFTRQSFTLNNFQMISMFSNSNYVMDFCGSVNINIPLIPWTKKNPSDPSTNNQRFLYIYDNINYSGRGYKYKQTFYVPYKTINNKDMCFTVGSKLDQSYPCKIIHEKYGDNNCDYKEIATKVNDNYYVLKFNGSYLDWGYEITAQYCYPQIKDYNNYYLKERQTWILIYY